MLALRSPMLAGRRHPHTIDRWDEATGENLIAHRFTGARRYPAAEAV